jgi:hypothetical protein
MPKNENEVGTWVLVHVQRGVPVAIACAEARPSKLKILKKTAREIVQSDNFIEGDSVQIFMTVSQYELSGAGFLTPHTIDKWLADKKTA